jgi:hypothetical protein
MTKTIRNTRMAAIIALFFCMFAGSALAQSSGESAYIEGIIYQVEAGVDMGPVGGADVTVTCLNNSVSIAAVSSDEGCNTVVDPNNPAPCGTYSVVHPNCAIGSEVEVSAVKGVLLGSNTDTVKQFYNQVGVGVSYIDVEVSAPEVLGALLVALLCIPGLAYYLANKKKE